LHIPNFCHEIRSDDRALKTVGEQLHINEHFGPAKT
jgi:hypothetical protein